MGRIGSVQALRFFAALAVVYCHASLNYGAGGGHWGAIGVDVFFVISGFIITRTARKNPEGFLRHRIARVLPPYYLVLIPWFIMAGPGGIDWRRTLASFLLWPVTDRFSMPHLFVAWSLCFEALFYLCVWLVLRGLPARLLLIGYAVSVAIGALTGWAVFRYLGSPLILEFLFGVGIAFLPTVRARFGWLSLALGCGLVWLYIITGQTDISHRILLGEGTPVRPIVWGFPAALLVFGTVQLSELKLGVLEFLGDASYSLYLIHLPVLLVLTYVQPGVGLAVAASVVAGVVFHLIAERPAVRVAKDLLKPRRRLLPAA